MDTLEYISLREAAQILGITLRAVRGRVKSRNVPLVTVAGKHGDRYLLQREHLSMLGEAGGEDGWTEGFADGAPRGDWSLSKTVPGEGYRAPRPEEPSPDTVSGNGWETVSETVDDTAGAPSDTVPGHGSTAPGIPVSVHRAALETARKAIESAREAHERAEKATERSHQLERAAWGLQLELTNYRRALTDQAESLAEREALNRQAAEQKIRLEELAKEREQSEALQRTQEEETQRLTEALRQAEGRVSQLEQKVPRWLRRMFGA